MKTTVQVECRDQELMVVNSPLIASGGIHENYMQFTFCEMWNGYGKTAVFYRNEREKYYSVLDVNNTCEIPHEVTDSKGVLFFGVFGAKGETTKTSKVLKYKVIQGALIEDLKPSEVPTPDIYQQLLAEHGKTQEMLLQEIQDRQAGDATERTAMTQAVANEKAERQAEIAVERARITAISQGTHGDAELADIRAGADGAVYESAGEAVRAGSILDKPFYTANYRETANSSTKHLLSYVDVNSPIKAGADAVISGGENFFYPNKQTVTDIGVTIDIDADGNMHIEGTATGRGYINLLDISRKLVKGDWLLKIFKTTSINAIFTMMNSAETYAMSSINMMDSEADQYGTISKTETFEYDTLSLFVYENVTYNDTIKVALYPMPNNPESSEYVAPLGYEFIGANTIGHNKWNDTVYVVCGGSAKVQYVVEFEKTLEIAHRPLVAEDARLANTLADGIVCEASGELINVKDASGKKIVSLGVYGIPNGGEVQKQYSGKNLLTYPYINTTITDDGITFTDRGDGSVNVSGTCTANYATFKFIEKFLCKENTRYIISGMNGVTTYLRYSVDSTPIYIEVTLTREISFETDTEVALYIQIGTGGTYSNILVKPMIRLATIEDDTWEPYVGGQSSPNPDYPQDINGVGMGGELDVVSGNKNLINYPFNDNSKTLHGITFTDNGDGTVTANGTATSNASFYLANLTNIKHLLNKELALSGCLLDGSASSYFIYARPLKNDNIIITKHDLGNGVTFVLPEETTELAIAIRITSGFTANNITFKPMLRLVGNSNEYEVHQSTTATLTTGLPLYAIPVTSGGNVEIDGQQYIADTLEVYRDGTGKVMKNIYEITANNNWILHGSNTDGNGTIYTLFGGSFVNGVRGYNTHFNYQYQTLWEYLQIGEFMNSGRYFVVCAEQETLEEFKSWLANNNCKGIVAISTPTEIPLTAEEVQALESLHTFKPVSNIYNSDGGYMSAEYVADTQLYIDNKFGSIVNGNEVSY